MCCYLSIIELKNARRNIEIRVLTFFEKDEFISKNKRNKNLISGLLFESPASFSLYQNNKENNRISLHDYSFMRN